MKLHMRLVGYAASALLALFPLPVCAQLSVDGVVRWTDSRGPAQPGSKHAAREVRVEICDNKRPPEQQVLKVISTDDSGNFSATLPVTATEHLDIVVRARSESPAASVQAVGTTQTWILPSQLYPNQTAGSSVHVDIVGNSASTPNGAFSVLDSLLGTRQFVSKVSQIDLPQVVVEFPTEKGTSFFDGSSLHILFGDKWDWDVTMHEYGHYVSKNFSLDDSPGGNHSLDENLGDRLAKGEALRLAWGEGWPTYFAITAQLEMGMASLGIPHVGDTRYTDTEDSTLDLDLASSDGGDSLGEDNEVSVMRVLYEVGQANSGSGLLPPDLWKILASAKPTMFSGALTAIDSNENLKQTLLIGGLAAKHRIAPSVIPHSATASLLTSSALFTWTANGGGKTHPNNQFIVRFYDPSMNVIAVTNSIATTSYQPSADEWKKLKDGGFSSWSVTGSNLDDPSSGPYLSGLLPAAASNSASSGNP
jgi:hypothetical protein